MLLFALALSLPLVLSQAPQEAEPTWRLHLQREGEVWRYVLYREERCADLATVRARLGAGAPSGGKLIVQCDGEAPFELVREAVAALGASPGWKLELAAEARHKDYLGRVGMQLEREKMLGFDGWMRPHYETTFGAGAPAMEAMWRDAERSLLAGQPFLAMNLFTSLPRLLVGEGAKSEYVQRPAKFALSGDALRRYLQAIDAELAAGREHGAKMLLDELGFLADARAAAYLLARVQDESWPFWVRCAAMRTLHRVRVYDEVVKSGIPQFWIAPYQDTPAAREELRNGLEILTSWWNAAQASAPEQVLPATKEKSR
ncbi:MAG: hypothetical protein JNM84_23865 [Planctomycetes bacterium]|nr:hypothetical protein [Planctomycetota bacterium]